MLVFVKGVGNELFGFQQVDIIEAWVPLFLFAVLFGLSMDYQVFLLSRIRERYAQTGRHDDAIAFGVGSTARLITGAALIIIAVFAGFARGDLVMFQQMGFGDRGRPLHRRDDHPLGDRAGDDEAPRPLELVPAVVARVAARRPRRGPRGGAPAAPRYLTIGAVALALWVAAASGEVLTGILPAVRDPRPRASATTRSGSGGNRPWHDWTVILLAAPGDPRGGRGSAVGGLVTGRRALRRGAAPPRGRPRASR